MSAGMSLKTWQDLAASSPSSLPTSPVSPPFPSSAARSPFTPSAPSGGRDQPPRPPFQPQVLRPSPAQPPRSSPGAADVPCLARSRGTRPHQPLVHPLHLLRSGGMCPGRGSAPRGPPKHTPQVFEVKEVAKLWRADRWLPLLIILSLI